MTEQMINLQRAFKIGVLNNLEAIVKLIDANKANAMELTEMMKSTTFEERILVCGAVLKHVGEEAAKPVERANKILLYRRLKSLKDAIKEGTHEVFLSEISSRELLEMSRIIAIKDDSEITDIERACLTVIDESLGSKMTEDYVEDSVDKAVASERIDMPKSM